MNFFNGVPSEKQSSLSTEIAAVKQVPYGLHSALGASLLDSKDAYAHPQGELISGKISATEKVPLNSI